ncbi:MAG TPA: methyltransferase [Panacibacter sp.]|nr:methyltransferase [Panacibacter sp.]
MAISLQLQTFITGDRSVTLYVPEPGQVKELYQQQVQEHKETAFPYWTKVWPAAIALTQFMFEHIAYVQNKNVQELAAGLGMPSIAAAGFAKSVCCSDYLPEAVETVQLTVMHHQLKNVKCRLLNWSSLPDDLEADTVLLSDINYNPYAFTILYQVLMQFIGKGMIVLLSTPQRLVSKSFIESLLPYCTHQQEIIVQEQNRDIVVTVMVLQKQ